ncbi:MAG: pitrilysin family protein [Calditrichia bacterium]
MNIRLTQYFATKANFVSQKGRRPGPAKILTIFFTLFFLLLSGSSLSAQSGQNVLRATLDNGLRVVIVRNTLAPAVTTVMNYQVGSDEAPAGFPGMAHAQEHMMFRGSPGLTANQLADISAAMGGDFDADTRQMVTQYFFTVPAEDIDVALHIEAIRMRGVLDTEKLWEKERGAIEQEVAQDLSNPEYVFYTKLLAAMFKGTVYAHDALGTKSSFNETTGAMLKRFHDKWYAPNNAILVIVGDVQPEATLEKVKTLFTQIPTKKLPPRPEFHFQTVPAETLNLKTDLPYGLAVISFRMPGSDSPDYAAAQILSDVLSSQRGDLYALVPEGKALYAGFSMNALPKAGLGYALAAYPKGADAQALLTDMHSILLETLKKGVSSDLVEAAKRQELAAAEFQKNSISGLAMAWSDALAVEGRNSPEADVQAMQKVTVEDVNRVAEKYLLMDHAITAILTPEVSGKPVSSKGFGGTESFAPQKTTAVKLPEWAEKALKRLEVPASTISPKVSDLPNGIKLIVQQENISNTISVYGHIRHNADLQVPRGQEGVGQVLDQLFSYGTTSLDRLAFQKALDDIGASESAGTSFSVEVLADHFDRGVQLLADNQLHPALPEKAFMITRQQLASTVAGQLQSPDYLASRALDSALVPDHDPTLRQATPASVSSLMLPHVKDYYKKVFRPDMTTIVVIGKISPEEAQKVIEKYFGEWKAEGPKPDVELPSIPVNKPSTTMVPDASRVQDQVTLAETIEITRSNPDYYALQLGNHVLGGAFYATRLYRDLREENGLVYYVSSSFDIGKTRAFYEVNYGCDPPNVAKARSIIQRDLEEMQQKPVTPDELNQAKALLLREIPLSESSINSIAGGLISRATHDLPLDEPTVAAHKYMKLTADQVKEAFAKWLRPSDLVQVTQGPAPK